MSNDVHKEFATLAGGCFWCIEAIFKRLIGVASVQSGFTGGCTELPTWEAVCTGQTGHAESVQIEFDPRKISFEQILNVFFHAHDPTTLNQQGHDKGTEYRSAIFYHDEQQAAIAKRVIKEFVDKGVYRSPIVTEITPLKPFYPADSYHKDFYESGERPDYCRYIIDPKLQNLLLLHGDILKEEYKSAF